MRYILPFAGACTSLLDTTPAERKEKGWMPVAILASFIIPINTASIYFYNRPDFKTNSFSTSILMSCLFTGMQWCAGRQFGHLLGRVLDEKQK